MATADEIEARRSIVADLLLNGWTAPAIARHVTVHHSTIYDDIEAIREQWKVNQTHKYDQWVAGELQTLSHMESKIAHRIDTGDLNAVTARLKIMERRAKMLGLDSPTRFVIEDSITAEIRELAEQLGMTDAPAVREILASVEPA